VVSRALSSNPRNSEDQLSLADGQRERLARWPPTRRSWRACAAAHTTHADATAPSYREAPRRVTAR
jgi:hypothetical protein